MYRSKTGSELIRNSQFTLVSSNKKYYKMIALFFKILSHNKLH